MKLSWVVRVYGVRFQGERLQKALCESELIFDRACYFCGEMFEEGDLIAVVRCGFDCGRSGVFHRGVYLDSVLGSIYEAAEKLSHL